MDNWTRNAAIRLGELASQVGLTPDNAEDALVLGARLLAHGFLPDEIQSMIQWQYKRWIDDEDAVMSGAPTLDQFARWTKRRADH